MHRVANVYVVQKQAEQLLHQNHELLEYIGELVSCLSQGKSASNNQLAVSEPSKVSYTSFAEFTVFVMIQNIIRTKAELLQGDCCACHSQFEAITSRS